MKMMIAVPTTGTREPETYNLLKEHNVPNVFMFNQNYGPDSPIQDTDNITVFNCGGSKSKITNLSIAANEAKLRGFTHILTVDDDLKYVCKQVGDKFERVQVSKDNTAETFALIEENLSDEFDCIGLKFPFPNNHEWARQPRNIAISTSCFALWKVDSLIECIELIREKNDLQTLRLGDDTMLAGALASLDMKYGQFQHIKAMYDIQSTITGIGSTIHDTDTKKEIDNIIKLYSRVEETYPHLYWQVTPEGLPTKPSKIPHKLTVYQCARKMPMKRVKFKKEYWTYFLDQLWDKNLNHSDFIL
ncbi:gp097 (endogenous virus) [Lactococcus phage KSY1]|uniref:Gp097 n=1 Tax=Lactococcus phage KSY1 TaxID=2913972 RepID=A6MAG2_9CAUD|nr:gp097 [Lactococcus phage KSY1]ABG21640.1 gp097 [Lactococcus phage KSY1]